MTKIGRNDYCPCRSGKKYKNCCINQVDRDKFLKDTLNAQYIDFNYMIGELMSSSQLLYEYLCDNLRWIRKPIMWLHNPDLKGNMRSLQLGDDTYAILLKEIPVNKNDYFDLAHEIGHLVLSESGYPSCSIIGNDSKKGYLASVLNNVILDPIINRQLKQYGFDFRAHIEKSIKIQVPVVKSYQEEEKLHKYDRHFLKCLLIQKILDWNLLDDDIENPFEEIYKQKYPTIYNEALEIIQYIKSLEWNTPQIASEILNKIIKDNDMTDTIQIM